MIIGVVNDGLEVTVRLQVRGPKKHMHKISAVVDTGFNGWLTLPHALIKQLKLPWDGRSSAILGDGNESVFDIYAAVVLWDRRKREIPIHEADGTPLVGTGLLADFSLRAEFRPRGRVKIERLGAR